MKKYLSPVLLLAVSIFFGQACSEDDPKKQESTVNHVGTPWKVSTVEYNMISQSLAAQVVKSGTASNAGTFYFDGAKGSFDITIEGIRKEDVFTYQEDAADVTITNISQSVGGSAVSQNAITLSGDKASATTMMLTGTIIKQSGAAEQFILTATFSLVKQ
jgi:hypothetical protein